MPIKAAELLLDLLYPPRCILCDALVAPNGQLNICRACKDKVVPVQEPCCQYCGRPVSENQPVCKSCAEDLPPYKKVVSLWEYQGSAREMIFRFKYRERPEYGKTIGRLMFHKASASGLLTLVDGIIPVPLHKSREKNRGYNQARLLAAEIARLGNLPLWDGALERVKKTQPQMNLDPGERAANMQGALLVKEENKIKGKLILIVDDIFTTGSTISACAQALLESGAGGVYGFCACCAISRRDSHSI